MGSVVVACLAVIADVVPTVKMTSGVGPDDFCSPARQSRHIPLHVLDHKRDVFPFVVSKLYQPLAEPLQHQTRAHPGGQHGDLKSARLSRDI
jgi:hypothetical protein